MERKFTSLTKATVVDGVIPFAGKIVAFRLGNPLFGSDDEFFRVNGETFGYIHWKGIGGMVSAIRRFVATGVEHCDCFLLPEMLVYPARDTAQAQDHTLDLRESTAKERAALFKALKTGQTQLEFHSDFQHAIAWE